ncbi:MAG: lytic murein transglycosylase [Bauldia sp.]|nr:lytic murein transglycosylase [Bauldia sp.]
MHPVAGCAARFWRHSVLIFVSCVFAGAVHAATPAQWVKSFWPTAKAAGISWATYQAALGNFTPDPAVLEKASNQAEFNQTIWMYLHKTVTERRIVTGQAMLGQYGALLKKIEARYGVDRHVVLAIWGMETTYGDVLNNPAIVKNVIRSLATLAYQGGSRAKFGRSQLVAALKIAQHGDITPQRMTGSWAGAMGHTQFIPTTYAAYAVDFDGDGKRDIWNNIGDALASTANYLKKSGWQSGATWGYEVTVPKGSYKLVGSERSLSAWQKLGVRRAGGKAFPRPGDSARLFAPAGADGPAFLLIKNFGVIKRYNNADAYALAVGHLADRIRGGGAFAVDWPDADLRLSDTELMQVQKLLADRGLYSGEIDGNIGSGSRAAIMSYQETLGLAADGQVSQKLLEMLQSGK